MLTAMPRLTSQQKKMNSEKKNVDHSQKKTVDGSVNFGGKNNEIKPKLNPLSSNKVSSAHLFGTQVRPPEAGAFSGPLGLWRNDQKNAGNRRAIGFWAFVVACWRWATIRL